MSRSLFIIFLILLLVIRMPLGFIFIVLQNFIPFLRKRLLFERKNLTCPSSRAFYRDSLKADFCFEVSSEGELEQVRPMMMNFLQKNKRIEILYSSESVEKKCMALYESYPNNVRAMRLPILTYFPFDFLYFQSISSFISAPNVFLCRYDFFPEILLLKWQRKKMILLAGSTKNSHWYKKAAFDLFDLIVAVSAKEKESFQLILHETPVFACDFRVERIVERISCADNTFKNFVQMTSYIEFLKKLPVNEKLILGSFWSSDIPVITNFFRPKSDKNVHLLIVPHKTDKASVEALKAELKAELNLSDEHIGVIGHQETLLNDFPSVVILAVNGVLCELYSLFKNAYVGGGYERSIHSVLEPFLAGARVFVGGNVQRSAEYDLLVSLAPLEIHLLNSSNSFYDLYHQHALESPAVGIRESLVKQTFQEQALVYEEIGK